MLLFSIIPQPQIPYHAPVVPPPVPTGIENQPPAPPLIQFPPAPNTTLVACKQQSLNSISSVVARSCAKSLVASGITSKRDVLIANSDTSTALPCSLTAILIELVLIPTGIISVLVTPFSVISTLTLLPSNPEAWGKN